VNRWLSRILAPVAAMLFAGAALPGVANAQSLIRDAEIEQALREYTDPLLVAARLDPKDVNIFIVSDPSLNAFVTNGQNIYLHTGLILEAQTPNQLIGVIAHETGHISGGHLARSAEAARLSSRPALISIGLGILAIAAGAPDAGAALISGSQQFAIANFFRHTQVQESSADQAAVTFLDATGQSGNGLLEFFEEFRYQEVVSEGRRNPYFRSHPLSSDRIQALRERVGRSASVNAVDTPERIEALKRMQAKLYGFLEAPARTYNRYPASDTSISARYARAVAAYKVPDTDSAVRETTALIEAEPNNPYFHEMLGQILFEAGRIEDSIPHHRRSVELLPNASLLQINLARALAATKVEDDLNESIKILEATVRVEPDNGFAWRELATAYDSKGESGLARLATAESAFSIGDIQRAEIFAQRAKRELEEGTASWRRASDIALVAQNVRNRGRG
jgi:predicted Zn-dependent protease